MAYDFLELTIAGQGGESALKGLDLFCRVIDIVKQYRKLGATIHNTNNKFLIGISMGCIREIRYVYHPDKGGQPTDAPL